MGFSYLKSAETFVFFYQQNPTGNEKVACPYFDDVRDERARPDP
jgi:hypothetical protein